MPCPCFIPSPRSLIRSPQSTVHCPDFLLTAKQNGYKHSNEEIKKVLEINYNCRKQFFWVTCDNCQNRSHSRAITNTRWKLGCNHNESWVRRHGCCTPAPAPQSFSYLGNTLRSTSFGHRYSAPQASCQVGIVHRIKQGNSPVDFPLRTISEVAITTVKCPK